MTPWATLIKAGITVTRVGENQIFLNPDPPEWVRFVKKHKQELLKELPQVKKVTKSLPITQKKTWKGGVGTELKKIIPNILQHSGCGCNDYAAYLDQKGIEWCENNKSETILYLEEKSKIGFVGKIIATKWVNKAIYAATTSQAEYYAKQLGTGGISSQETVVVTATDDRYINGATLAIWTLLLKNKVKIRCYDLGISSGPMKKQLLSWGVEFVKPPYYAVPQGVPGWQIFNKPVYIRHALKAYSNVVWLDADVAVGGDISGLIATDTIKVPDHGGFNAIGNTTTPPISKFFGPDKTTWSGTHFPCAGVMGVNRNHITTMDLWVQKTQDLYQADLHQHAQYYDQSIFQTFYTGPLVDGSIYNHFGCPRTGSQKTILDHMIRYPRIIHHFGGSKKPFLDWNSFTWPKPRGADS